MFTINLRVGPAELLSVVSVAVTAGLLTVAFVEEWTFALVPAVTYVLATSAAYGLYRVYLQERSRASVPASVVKFRVVDTRGACPLGWQMGDVATVGDDAVSPQLCPEAAAVLRLAASGRESQPVEEWCCPVYEHMLVFRHEKQAA